MKTLTKYFLGAFALGSVILGAPLVPVEQPLLYSVERPLFDTPSTKLDAGYYYVENGHTFFGDPKATSTTGLQEAHATGKIWISYFSSSEGIIEVPIPATTYHAMGMSGGAANNPKHYEGESLLSLITPEVQAAITFDAATTGVQDLGTSLTFAHTCTASDLIYVGVGTTDGTNNASSVTYNAVALTMAIQATNGSTHVGEAAVWYLSNPSSGANNVVVDFPFTARYAGGATCLAGTNTSSPIGATNQLTGNSNSVSQSITTTQANSVVVDSVLDKQTGTDTKGASQTQIWQVACGLSSSHCEASSQSAPTTGSYTMSWSLGSAVVWATALAEILPAATATPAPRPILLIEF